MSEKQYTLSEKISFLGKGLHTGKVVNMTIHPAAENHGIKFKRIDLENQPIILADVGKVSNTQRSTTITQSGCHVITIEHTLSALLGAGIDNALIEIDAEEVPILDGSASPIMEQINKVGKTAQDADREYFEVEEVMSFFDKESGAELYAIPDDEFSVTVMIDFNSEVLGTQYAEYTPETDYTQEIAPARTFVFVRELQHLADKGLIKGGGLDNAVVIMDKQLSQDELDELSEKLGHPRLQATGKGILNNTDLRFINEPARHKLLDVLGDLSLIGRPIKGKIIAKKTGHKANIAFAKMLKAAMVEKRKLKGKPKYDPTQTPVYTGTQVYEMLPHRYPFQMVDKIVELTDTCVVGIKNVTMNEPTFMGHFPDNPVFPGVLQLEALAQCGGVLALTQMNDPKGYDTYFLKLDSVKFKRMIKPGDTVILKCELLAPIRRGIVNMFAIAYVGNNIVSEGELMAQLVPKHKRST